MQAGERLALPRSLDPLLGAAGITILAGLVAQFLLLVSSVLAARLLGPEARGHLALLAIWPPTLVLLGSMGVPVGVTYLLSRSGGEATVRQIRGASLTLAALLSGFLSVLYVIGLMVLGEVAPAAAKTALWLATASVPPFVLLAVLGGVAQTVPGMRLFNAMRILPPAGYAAGLVLLAITGRRSLESVSIVWVASYLVAGATVTFAVWRLGVSFSGTRGPAQQILRYGLDSYVGAIGSAEIQRLLEQIVIALIVSSVGLGQWDVAISVVQVLSLPARSIGMVAFPDIARSENAIEAIRKTRRYLLGTTVVVGGLAAVLIAGSGLFIPVIYGDEFAAAVPVVQVLAVSALLQAVRRLLGDALRGVGSPRTATVSEIANLALLVVLLIPLTAVAGLVGATIAVLVAAGASLVLQLATMPAELAVAAILRLHDGTSRSGWR